jgi:hypothetical protein
VHERELVVQLADWRETFPHQRRCLIGVAPPDRQRGAEEQRTQLEPRSAALKRRRSFAEQSVRLHEFPGRHRDAGHAGQRVADAPGVRELARLLKAASVSVERRLLVSADVRAELIAAPPLMC